MIAGGLLHIMWIEEAEDAAEDEREREQPKEEAIRDPTGENHGSNPAISIKNSEADIDGHVAIAHPRHPCARLSHPHRRPSRLHLGLTATTIPSPYFSRR